MTLSVLVGVLRSTWQVEEYSWTCSGGMFSGLRSHSSRLLGTCLLSEPHVCFNAGAEAPTTSVKETRGQRGMNRGYERAAEAVLLEARCATGLLLETIECGWIRFSNVGGFDPRNKQDVTRSSTRTARSCWPATPAGSNESCMYVRNGL